jgi:hypothetical protein
MTGRTRGGSNAGLLALGALLVLAALRRPIFGAPGDGLFASYREQTYQAVTLAFNWIDLGPVRRGLGGTVARLLSDDPMLAAAWFHVLFAVCVAAGTVALLRGWGGSRWERLAAATVALGLMLRWSDDFGRTDIAVAALLVGATLAARAGRDAVAAAAVAVSVLVHETGFVYGLPLLLALRFARAGRIAGWRTTLVALAILAGGAAAWGLVSALSPTDASGAVAIVRSRFEPAFHVDTAIYYATSGLRGVATSLCQNRIDPLYALHFASALAVVAAAAVASASGRTVRPAVLALAAIPPFVFLYVVANDMARWTMFSCLNVWLVASVAPPRAARRPAHGRLACAAALAFLALSSARFENSAPAIYIPSPLLERAVRKVVGGRSPPIEEVLPVCDPAWRSAIGNGAR